MGDILPNYEGQHNSDLEQSIERLHKGQTYKDLSTIIVVPTRGLVPAHVVGSWMGLMRPMNQKIIGPIFFEGYEVGDAYNQAVHGIISNPDLCKFKYLLTLEEDNTPPPDGILKLIEAIEGQVDGNKYDAVGGLYWTKGAGGQPMCYGDPAVFPLNFIPQVPIPGSVKACNGLGMGFTLYRMEMIHHMYLSAGKDPKSGVPLVFWTRQEYSPEKGGAAYTQDLYFFERAAKEGFKFACDARCKVGHYDHAGGITW